MNRFLSTLLIIPIICAGCLSQEDITGTKQQAPANGNQAPDADPVAPPAVVEPEPNALKREAKLVDRNKFLAEHPDAIEIEKNVINASDPFTASSQAYFAGVSSLMISAYTADLRLWKELNNGKWPTFEKYQEILNTHGVKLKGLKKGQVYAYDDQQGTITILEVQEAE